MEVEGKIILALPEQSGVSRAGNNWKKREYVLETHETYPKKVFFVLFGDRADQYPLNVGDEIRLSFDINSREYNGRWFTSIDGWKVEPATAPAAPGAPAPQTYAQAPAYGAPAAPVPDLTPEPNDDLPF
ncbi:DUF3127 domain-containing protein [uncultured Muribaculum sp.]|uniref:DUF3127 domain-containing protein n=1 Tax=uncultured Muribaculum sp. TaxID=1918613 RepID=UPI0025F4D889|nr:DUF3127 domain-containing protein [uncultured Muribaculum sp.]